MRVLFVSYLYAPSIGGVERQSHLLARSLVARGHAVRVIAGRLDESAAHEWIDGVEIARVARGRGGRWLRMATFLGGVTIRAASWGRWADVVQVQQALFPAAAMAVLARALGRPVIVRNSSSGSYGAVQLMRRLPFGAAALTLIARLSTVVTLNAEMTEEMRSSGARRIVQIPSGVEAVPAATPADRAVLRERLAIEGRIVLYLGRLDAEKGVSLLLEAWPLLMTSPAHLLIVGEGPAYAELVGLAARLSATAGKVRFRGATSDAAGHLRGADVVVLPSISEGISNVGLEAMACGVPVVATDVGGNRELIQHRGLGILVPPGDPAALARAIDGVLADPAAAAAMARAARAHVREHHSLEQMAAAYERLYASVMRLPSTT